MEEDVHERIQKLLVTGDNRLKQGVDPAKARESWEQALALAREAGLEERIRPLVEVRLADLSRRPAEDRLDPLRLAADVVLGGRLARGDVRARQRRGLLERAREGVDVERVDEHAGLGRDELGRASDPGRDDRAPAGHRLEQRLAERLHEARLREHAALRRAGAGSRRAGRARAGSTRSRPSSCGRSGPSPAKVSVPSAEAREGVGEADDVLPLVERADAEEAGRARAAAR